jgi:hypothetical protein
MIRMSTDEGNSKTIDTCRAGTPVRTVWIYQECPAAFDSIVDIRSRHVVSSLHVFASEGLTTIFS